MCLGDVVLQFTPRDAGYTATDAAIKIVQKYAQCKWISCTNGDNIYGSNVFHNVLTSPKESGERNYDAVLVPLDSRNYAEQGTARTTISPHFLLRRNKG
jgi:hypothetical protein